jgi:hypothetical protein
LLTGPVQGFVIVAIIRWVPSRNTPARTQRHHTGCGRTQCKSCKPTHVVVGFDALLMGRGCLVTSKSRPTIHHRLDCSRRIVLCTSIDGNTRNPLIKTPDSRKGSNKVIKHSFWIGDGVPPPESFQCREYTCRMAVHTQLALDHPSFNCEGVPPPESFLCRGSNRRMACTHTQLSFDHPSFKIRWLLNPHGDKAV